MNSPDAKRITENKVVRLEKKREDTNHAATILAVHCQCHVKRAYFTIIQSQLCIVNVLFPPGVTTSCVLCKIVPVEVEESETLRSVYKHILREHTSKS